MRSACPPGWRKFVHGQVAEIQIRQHMKRGGTMTACLAAIVLLAGNAQAADLDARRAQVADLVQRAFGQLMVQRGRWLKQTYPERTRLSVYVAVTGENFLLRSATVTVDDRIRAKQTYTRRQAKNLLGNALDRVLRVNVSPGTHHVRIHFSGQLKGAELEGVQLTGSLALKFEKTSDPKALILPAVPRALRSGSGGAGNSESWLWRTQTADPRLAQARFLRANGRYVAAAMELVTIGAAGDEPTGYHLHWARVFVDFGMPKAAREALHAYARGEADRQLVKDVRLRLADLALQRGELARAQRILDRLRGDLVPVQFVRWQGLMARLRMRQGRYSDAVAVLDRGDTEREVMTQPQQPGLQTLYMRYNHAIAMLRSGETARGRTLLDRIGRMETFSRAQRVLSQRATVALAYQFLDSGQGAIANDIFQRVPLHGAYSSIALLGMGWSELAPRGSEQPRALVGGEPEPGAYGTAHPERGRIFVDEKRLGPFRQIYMGPFRMADMPDEKRLARRQAVALWQVLRKRSLISPAVQEAWVATGSVLEKLGAGKAAQRIYRQAITQMRQLGQRYGQLIDDLRSCRVSRPAGPPLDMAALVPRWRRIHLGGLSGARWISGLLASSDFQEALSNVRELRLLARALELSPVGFTRSGAAPQTAGHAALDTATPKDDAVTDLPARLHRMAKLEMQRLCPLAIDELKQQRTRLRDYLRAAHLRRTRLGRPAVDDARDE